MQLSTASKKKSRIRLGVQGPSRSGKTYSSVLVASGLTSDWSKIAVVDTESGSAHLYSDLGTYQVLPLDYDHSPESYIDAIGVCEKAGMEVIIIDSLSHEWQYVIDYHANLPGNSFTNWAKVTPRHDALVQKILHSPAHVIGTIRTKQEYVLNEKNGKQVPEKVGLKGIQRDGIEYEFTLVFDLDIRNNATASKDRTGLFYGKPENKLTANTGHLLLQWCNTGKDVSVDELSDRIANCASVGELISLYNLFPQFQESLKPEFEQHKRRILIHQQAKNTLINNQTSANGKHD